VSPSFRTARRRGFIVPPLPEEEEEEVSSSLLVSSGPLLLLRRVVTVVTLLGDDVGVVGLDEVDDNLLDVGIFAVTNAATGTGHP